MIAPEWAPLAEVFGSESRLMTLAVLAGAEVPLSGYRIAQIGMLSPPKVYAELRKLNAAGIVAQQLTGRGSTGWVLADQELGKYLRLRVRIASSAEWFAASERRWIEASQWLDAKAPVVPRFKTPPNPGGIPNAREFLRPRSKDETLARIGERTSRRLRARS